jgi:hypothetical protein
MDITIKIYEKGGWSIRGSKSEYIRSDEEVEELKELIEKLSEILNRVDPHENN